uniref:Periplasmic copper-binding protein n=1 Tax=uncultured marine group II/III euryarchaeote KM3_149_F06 TaxID=1457885 RepID=A0A075GBR1_9EURY|nr:periplasmic copper-binding protein [uncultured marine group II/III euryarchaeote KM3_149_F06]
MVHKKYTYKNGKRYGPYLYETKRVDGKIVTTYLGSAFENSTKDSKRTINLIPILLILGLVLVISFLFLYFPIEFTGRATLDVQANYEVGELITGNLNLNIKSGELIPEDSAIVISLGDVVKEIFLSELVSVNVSEGEFYAEGFEISGEGNGFGLLGGKTIYPEIEFDLKVFNSVETDSSGSGFSGYIEENETEESVDEEVNDSVVSEEIIQGNETEAETAQVNEFEETEEIVEGESIEEVREEVEEEIQEESTTESEESSSSLITGEVILEGERTISGVVSFENEFSYGLSEGGSVEIVEGSLSVEEAELSLEIVEGTAKITTDYLEIVKGFGEEFLGEDNLVLKIDISQFSLIAEESSELKIELVYGETILAEEEKDISVEEVVEVVNETIANETIIANVTVSTIQYGAVLGKPVRWKKKIELSEASELSVELPSVASNISITKIVKKEIEEELIENETQEVVVESESEVIVEEVFPEVEEDSEVLEDAGSPLTGLVTIEVSDEVVKEMKDNSPKEEGFVLVEFDEIVEEVEIEYDTPAPYAEEEEKVDRKIVKIVGPEEVHYENVLAFTELSEDYGITNAQQIRINWIENGTYLQPQLVGDIDENGIYDYVEWIVPHLSNQTFEIIVVIRAEHLDENRTSISDIYGEVKALDGNWSETIPEEHYVRIVFEKNLTSDRDITIYPRIVKGTPRVEVYEINGTELVAEFASINSEELNKIYLTSLTGEQDTFDLKIVGGSLEFDYIVDPTAYLFEDCDSLSDWSLTKWVSTFGDLCQCSECTVDNMSLTSSLDLSGTSNANLSFDWWYVAFESSGDFLKIYASDDDGGTYTQVFSTPGGILPSQSDSGSYELKLEDYISLTSTVKLRGSCTSHISTGRSDPQGKCKWDSINITGYDLVGPGVTINVPTASNYSSASFDFNVTLNENGSVMFSLNGGTTNTSMDSTDNQNFNYTNSSVLDGSYTFQVYANDTLGNDNHTESVDFVVDTTSPVISYVSPTEDDGFFKNSANVLVNVTVTETNLKNISSRLYNSSNVLLLTSTGTSSPLHTVFLQSVDGLFYYNSTAYDYVGNSVSAPTRNLTIDTTHPTFNMNEPLNQTYTSVQTSFDPSPSDTNIDTCWYSLDGGATNTTIGCNKGISLLNSGQGSSTWTAYANDSAGNENSSSVTFFVDSISPEVTINVPANITYGWNNVSMDFNVTLSENGSVMFSLDGGTTNTTMDTTDNQKFNYTNSSMIEGSYTFQVYANDTLGNINYSVSNVFTVNNSLVYNCGTLSDAGRTYYLQNDISTTGDCFIISADNITFDGGNYNVDGDDSGGDYAVNMSDRFNVTVKNFNITDFDSGGIRLLFTNESTIILNNVSGSSDGILLLGSLRNKIQNNTLVDNFYSIRLDTTGSIGTDNNTIEYNIITSPTVGIVLKNNANNNTFYKNKIDSSTSAGIDLVGGEDNHFNETIINNSLGNAMAFYVADNNVFNNLTIENTNLSHYDVKFVLSNADGNKFVNTPIANYTISGTGSKLIIKESGLGEIRFLEVVNGSGTNLSNDIQIASNFVRVDSASSSGLNKSANVTLYGTPAGGLSNPDILRDGEICPSSICYNFTSLTAATVVFNVTGWSNYTIGDKTSPAVTIVSPANNTNTTDTGLDILYTATDSNLDSCWYSNDTYSVNTTLSGCANITTVVWSEKNHKVTIWANDTAGNENVTDKIFFTIDTTFPTFNITQPLNQTYTSVQTAFGHNSADNALDTCWYSLDGGVTNVTIEAPSPCGLSPGGLDSGEGLSTWRIWANDTAGNENSSYVTFFVDSLSPEVTVNVPENKTYTTSSFDFNVSLNENGSVEFSLDAGETNYTMDATDNQNFNYSTTLSDGTYTFQVYANDTLGNNNHTENVTFTVAVPEEAPPPRSGGGGSAAVSAYPIEFSVSPSSLAINIIAGDTKELTVEITNNNEKGTIPVVAEVTVIDEDILKLSDKGFSLKGGESRIIRLTISNVKRGIHVGEIKFTSGTFEEKVKVSINVKSDAFLLESSIAIGKEQEVTIGDDFIDVQINLKQIGKEKKKKEVTVELIIKDFNGKYWFEKTYVLDVFDEKVFLEDLPTHNLPPGNYVAGMIVTYPGEFAAKSAQFEVKEEISETSKRKNILLIVAISSALSILLVLYFLFVRRKGIKKVLKYRKVK